MSKEFISFPHIRDLCNINFKARCRLGLYGKAPGAKTDYRCLARSVEDPAGPPSEDLQDFFNVGNVVDIKTVYFLRQQSDKLYIAKTFPRRIEDATGRDKTMSTMTLECQMDSRYSPIAYVYIMLEKIDELDDIDVLQGVESSVWQDDLFYKVVPTVDLDFCYERFRDFAKSAHSKLKRINEQLLNHIYMNFYKETEDPIVAWTAEENILAEMPDLLRAILLPLGEDVFSEKTNISIAGGIFTKEELVTRDIRDNWTLILVPGKEYEVRNGRAGSRTANLPVVEQILGVPDAPEMKVVRGRPEKELPSSSEASREGGGFSWSKSTIEATLPEVPAVAEYGDRNSRDISGLIEKLEKKIRYRTFLEYGPASPAIYSTIVQKIILFIKNDSQYWIEPEKVVQWLQQTKSGSSDEIQIKRQIFEALKRLPGSLRKKTLVQEEAIAKVDALKSFFVLIWPDVGVEIFPIARYISPLYMLSFAEKRIQKEVKLILTSGTYTDLKAEEKYIKNIFYKSTSTNEG